MGLTPLAIVFVVYAIAQIKAKNLPQLKYVQRAYYITIAIMALYLLPGIGKWIGDLIPI